MIRRDSDDEESSEELSEREQNDFDEDFRSEITLQLEKQKSNKHYVNEVAAMQQKIEEIQLTINGSNEVPWVETLLMSIGKVEIANIEDDLVREQLFYDMALKAATTGLERLHKEKIPYTRPTDFFAEMIKTDEHMSKVKGVLLKEKRLIEEAQQRTKIRMQRKFSKKTQVEVQQKRQKEKKEELEAIKKWRKSRKGNNTADTEFPEELLNKNSAARKQLANSTNSNKNKQRITNTQKKAIKYGMGGKKRGMKNNTAESSRDMSDYSVRRNKSTEFNNIPRKKKPDNRPGKRKRQQGWSSSGGKKFKRQKTK